MESKEVEETNPELKPHPPRFTKLTRNIPNSASESYVKSLLHFKDYIYELKYSKESELQSIDSYFFTNSKLYSVTFPPSLTVIEAESMNGLTYLYEILFLKNDEGENFLEKIGYKAFYDTEIESIIIPNNIINIESNCFPKCLKSIEFEKGAPSLQKVGDFSFSKTQIEEFKMPLKIDPFLDTKNHFLHCYKLNKIVFDSYVNKEEPPSIDFPQEDEVIKKWQIKFNENGQNMIYLETIKDDSNYYNDSNDDDCFIERKTLDLAWNCTLSQVPNLKSIEVFITNLNNFYFFNMPNLTSIQIPESDKGQYIKHKGCLYTKDKKKLIVAERSIENTTILANCQLISNYALNVKSLEKVTFEDDSELQEISIFAFAESNIKEINIPDSVHLINYAAFYKSSLEQINIPKSLNLIEMATFSYSKLTKIKIPNSIISIELGSFYKCSQLKEVEFEEESQLKYINNYAFADTKIESISIPKSVEKIGDFCFINCNELKKINFDDNSNLSYIGDECFKGTMIDDFQIPQNIESYDFSNTNAKTVTFSENSLFYCLENFQCSKITHVNIPPSISEIRYCAFIDCVNLTKVEIIDIQNSKLESIGKDAFLNCTSLEEFEIPKSVNYFGINSFKNCSKYHAQISIDNDNIIVCENAFENSGITIFKSKCQKLTVNNLAFNNCINLVQFSVEAEKSIILGSSLFVNCKSLIDVKLNTNTEKAVIYECCFMNAPIKSINIPKNLIKIPKDCFKNCQDLTQVTIDQDSNLNIFDVEAFSGSGVNSIFIPSKTTIIDEKCFKDCSNLKKVTFSNQLQKLSVKKKAFYNSGIQQLNIIKGIDEIDESCFKKCSNLTKLTFENDILIKKIKKHTFQSSGIKSLILPPQIIFIKKSAFKDCKQLQNVTFQGEANVSKNAFTGCDKLQTVKCDNSIIVKTLNVPKVFYQSQLYFKFNQQQIDETLIKAIMVNSEPFFQHFQRYDFNNTLVFNMESRFKNLFDCYKYKQNFSEFSKYQIVEYKEGGYYSNLMKNLLFCDFSTKEITVSKDTEVIESEAFKYSNLKLIDFEENSLLQRINSYAFEFLQIEEIEIPDSVIYIGDYAFSNCYSLRRVSINQTSNLSKIGKFAFAKTAIKTILFPSTLRTISEGAFYECYMLTQAENYSNEISFGHAAFYRSSIEKIDFPAKSYFFNYSFNSCKRLKKISFSDNKEKALFGEDSFSFSGLEEIEIHCDAEIHTQAFAFCSKLKKIKLDGNIICSKNSFHGSNLQECTLNLTKEFDKDPLLCYNNIVISNIDKCSLKYCENIEFNLRNKCYVFNNTLEYADLIDNFSLTEPYRNESKRTPIKKNEILRVPKSVKRMDFPQMTHIKLIIFPSNCLVEDLGSPYSFSYCNLIEITIPKLVQKIPPHCFEHCHYLKTVKFEEESILDEIGEFSFSNTRVRKVILPSSVKIIRNSAFSNNLDLREVKFDGEIIEDEAFSQTGITSFILSNNTKSIGSKAFQYCSELKTFSIDIDNSNLSEIGTYAFLGTSISSINIPPNVKAIKSFTFDDCQCLEKLNISMKSELEEVDKFSFSIETNLKAITLPRSILNLFNEFIGEPSLHSVLYETNQQFCVIESQENPEKCSIVLNFSDENTHNSLQNNCCVVDHELIYADLIDNAGLFEPSTPEELDSLTKRNEVLAVPANTKKLNFPIMSHVKRILWSSSNIIEDIGPSGFFSYYNLIQITIPKSVQIIPPHAFDHCHFLSKLAFEPKSQLKEIGKYSFSNTRIKTAILPNSVQIIHKAAFANNLDLKEVSFIGEIIEDEAFSQTGLTSFILSNNTKSIGSKAFQYCRSLKTFSINIDYSSLSEIGTYAFTESSIISINIPPNVKTIKSFTFSGCNLLKVVNISTESSLEEIEEYSFAENLSLKFINIPKTIKKLSFEAFINTPSLQSIMKESNDKFNVLEDNSVYGNDRTLVFAPRFLKQFKVIENCLIIHSGAFCGPNLEEVIFMDNSLMCIEKCAFAHTNGLKKISIPNSIRFIGEEAFIHCENLEIVQFDQESQILEIPKFCFAFSGLKAIILPNSIEFINQSSFYFCRYLTNININNTNVKYIGDYAFALTKIEEVIFPSSIEYIGSHSFEGNKSLKLIDLTNISHVEETNPNQFREFKKLIYKSHKKDSKIDFK